MSEWNISDERTPLRWVVRNAQIINDLHALSIETVEELLCRIKCDRIKMMSILHLNEYEMQVFWTTAYTLVLPAARVKILQSTDGHFPASVAIEKW